MKVPAFLLFAVPSLFSLQRAAAQQPCAAVNGVVHDTTAGLIPGATVVLDGATTATSGQDGRFTFDCVATGIHTLHVDADGFASTDITSKLPSQHALELTLTPAVQTTVDVDAGNDTTERSASSAGPSQTIAGQQLQQLADDPDDLLRQVQQLAAEAGGSPSNATISVDGFQDSTHLPPKNSIAYIKVNPDVFSAEYREPPFGNGGRVEIYTKPGQSTFHGALFTTNGSPWENARDPFSVTKAAIGKQRYGFELGGPIRRQISDFFVSLEYRAIDNFGVVNAVELDASNQVVPILANVPTPQRLWQPTAKVTWQVSPRNTFIASYTGSVSNLRNVGVGGTTLAEAGYDSQQWDHTLRFSNVTTVGANLMHEARLSLRWVGETDTPASTLPQVQVAGAFTGGGATLGAQHLGGMRLEYDDDAIYTTKHHTLKAGLLFFENLERRRLTTNFNGTYVFGGGTAPALDGNNQPIAGQTTTITGLEQYRRARLNLAGGTPTAFTGVTGNPNVNFNQSQGVLYVQDDWKLSHGVMVSGGLRYFAQSDPTWTGVLTPRLGVVWSPGKDNKWSLHAHAGMFAGRFGRDDYAEVLREDGVNRVTSLVYNPDYGAPYAGDAVTIHAARTLSPHLSDTLYGMYNIGGNRTLPHGFNLMADLGWGRLWNYTRSNNINAPLTDSPTGPRPLAPNLNLLEVQSSGQGRLDFEFFGVENHGLKHVQFFAGAVHINQFDDTNDDTFFTPQNSRSDAGEFARRSDNGSWQAFGNLSIPFWYKLRFSGDFYGFGNQHYNITTGFDNNGDGNFNDRPQYAAAGTPEAISTRYGLLVASGGTGVFGRNRGVLPWNVHLDANLERAFTLTRNSKADHQQTLTANLRSSNLINHTNVTSVGGVLGSPLFGVPFAADNGRRVEAGLRYSF